MSARTCPTCGRPVVWDDNPDRPFCSERCRVIDLGRWSAEEYVVPGTTVEPDSSAPSQSDDDEQ